VNVVIGCIAPGFAVADLLIVNWYVDCCWGDVSIFHSGCARSLLASGPARSATPCFAGIMIASFDGQKPAYPEIPWPARYDISDLFPAVPAPKCISRSFPMAADRAGSLAPEKRSEALKRTTGTFTPLSEATSPG